MKIVVWDAFHQPTRIMLTFGVRTMETVCPAELNIGPFGTCPSTPPGWPGLGPPNWTLGRRIFSQNSKISFKSGRLIKFAHSWFTTFAHLESVETLLIGQVLLQLFLQPKPPIPL